MSQPRTDIEGSETRKRRPSVPSGEERDGYENATPHRDGIDELNATVKPNIVAQIDETTPLLASAVTIAGDDEATQRRVRSRSRQRSRRRTASKASPRRLLVPFFIYCFAMGAVAVPKLNVILTLMCIQYGEQVNPQGLHNDEICRAPAVHAKMGRFMMYANIISGIGCALSSPRIGALSDRVGRKPLLAFTALGLLFGDVISIAAGWAPRSISVYWVLLEFGIGGLTGSFGATMAMIQTYASDCAKGEARASIFARFHACMYLGSALGPPAGALWIRFVGGGDMLSVFYVAILCHGAFIIFVLYGITESLPRSKGPRASSSATSASSTSSSIPPLFQRVQRGLKSSNPFRPLKILRPSKQTPSTASRRNLPLLAIIDSVTFGIQLGLVQILVIYAENRIGWRTMEASLFVSVINITRTAVLIVLPIILSRKATTISQSHQRALSDPEEAKTPSSLTKSNKNVDLSILTIRIAILIDLLSQLGFAISSNATLFVFSGILAAAAAPISPTIQSLMTSYVDADKYGELLGTVSLCHALARILVPGAMQLIYSVTVNNIGGTVFWVLGLLFAALFGLSLRIRS